MKTIPTEVLNEIEKEFAITCLLFEIPNSNIYYNNTEIYLIIDGVVYESYAFNVGNIDLTFGKSVNTVLVNFDNVRTDFLYFVLNNQVVGEKASLKLCAIGSDKKPIGAATIFKGFISRATANDSKIEITLVDQFSRWRDRQLNIHSPLCSWRFKDPYTCKYSGTETWCDKTYERCTQLGNTTHFRGFRFLPKLQEKEIWWGKTQK